MLVLKVLVVQDLINIHSGSGSHSCYLSISLAETLSLQHMLKIKRCPHSDSGTSDF